MEQAQTPTSATSDSTDGGSGLVLASEGLAGKPEFKPRKVNVGGRSRHRHSPPASSSSAISTAPDHQQHQQWRWVSSVLLHEVLFLTPAAVHALWQLIPPSSQLDASSLRKYLQDKLLADFPMGIKFVHLMQPSRLFNINKEFSQQYLASSDSAISAMLQGRDVGGALVIIDKPAVMKAFVDRLLPLVPSGSAIPVPDLQPPLSLDIVRHLIRPKLFPISYLSDYLQVDEPILRSPVRTPLYFLLITRSKFTGTDEAEMDLDRVWISNVLLKRHEMTIRAGHGTFVMLSSPTSIHAWTKVAQLEPGRKPADSIGNHTLCSLKLSIIESHPVPITAMEMMYPSLGSTKTFVDFGKFISLQGQRDTHRDTDYVLDIPFRHVYGVAWLVGYLYQMMRSGIPIDAITDEWAKHRDMIQTSDAAAQFRMPKPHANRRSSKGARTQSMGTQTNNKKDEGATAYGDGGSRPLDKVRLDQYFPKL